jgi:hypothetical protein
MTSRIADWISFRFDDPPAEPARGNINVPTSQYPPEAPVSEEGGGHPT